MALYSTSVRTRDLDPSSNIPNQKVEFRLPNDASFYPNMRLANVGVIQAGNHHYNRIGGAYACIKHVRLLSNGQELDGLRFANRYLSWLNINNSNEDNLNVNKILNKNSLGYDVLPNHEINSVREQRVPAQRDEALLSHLDLRKCLPLLSAMPVLDTSLFPNCVLQVELEDDPETVTTVNNQATSVQSPVLLIDEITSPEVQGSLKKELMKGVVYSKVEHDVVRCPAQANPASTNAPNKQDVSLRYNAYDDKFISRIVFMKTFANKSLYINTANSVVGLGDFGSLACHKERWNLRLNGALMFPSNLENKSTRAQYLFDAFGKVNYIPYGDYTCVGLDEVNVQQVNVRSVPYFANTQQGQLVGSMSFVGFNINEKVNEMSILFGRDAPHSAAKPNELNASSFPNTQELDIHAYAECRKSISFSGNSMNISYL